MESQLGIKLANGKFFSIFAENETGRKKLVLPTVFDNQASVQTDLLRSASGTMADVEYIGSIVVADITPVPHGVPSIEVVIQNDGSEITATADVYIEGEKFSAQNLSIVMNKESAQPVDHRMLTDRDDAAENGPDPDSVETLLQAPPDSKHALTKKHILLIAKRK